MLFRNAKCGFVLLVFVFANFVSCEVHRIVLRPERVKEPPKKHLQSPYHQYRGVNQKSPSRTRGNVHQDHLTSASISYGHKQEDWRPVQNNYANYKTSNKDVYESQIFKPKKKSTGRTKSLVELIEFTTSKPEKLPVIQTDYNNFYSTLPKGVSADIGSNIGGNFEKDNINYDLEDAHQSLNYGNNLGYNFKDGLNTNAHIGVVKKPSAYPEMEYKIPKNHAPNLGLNDPTENPTLNKGLDYGTPLDLASYMASKTKTKPLLDFGINVQQGVINHASPVSNFNNQGVGIVHSTSAFPRYKKKKSFKTHVASRNSQRPVAPANREKNLPSYEVHEDVYDFNFPRTQAAFFNLAPSSPYPNLFNQTQFEEERNIFEQTTKPLLKKTKKPRKNHASISKKEDVNA